MRYCEQDDDTCIGRVQRKYELANISNVIRLFIVGMVYTEISGK